MTDRSTTTRRPRRLLPLAAGLVIGGIVGATTVAVAGRATGVRTATGAAIWCPGGMTSLAHVFDEDNSMFPGDPETHIEAVTSIAADGFLVEAVSLGTHTGTHIDAPGHFIEGGRTVDELRPDELVMPVYVIDVRARIAQVKAAGKDPDFFVRVGDIRRYERRHGRIPAGALVVLRTGYDEVFGTPAYDEPAPGFTGGAVQWLVDARGLNAVGSDTYGPDSTRDTNFLATYTILRNDHIALPGLANLESLARTGDIVSVSPVRLRDGSGFQVNPVACHGTRS